MLQRREHSLGIGTRSHRRALRESRLADPADRVRRGMHHSPSGLAKSDQRLARLRLGMRKGFMDLVDARSGHPGGDQPVLPITCAFLGEPLFYLLL